MFAGSAIPTSAQEKQALRLVRTIPLPEVTGRLDHLGVDLEKKRLFVAAVTNNTLEVVDLTGGKPIAAGEAPALSPLDEMSSAPLDFNKSLARLICADVSQWTDSRVPPFLTRPSYLLASYSGIPMPTKAPTMPPTAPPTPRPARPAIMGPAAINGPTPGIARAPTPASTPSVPPIKPPVVTPAAVPSGAFVSFTCATLLCYVYPEAKPKYPNSDTPQ
jgi:hypothetical protein